MANKDFVVKNGLVVNDNFVANSTVIRLGNTININTSAISVGNGTVNAVITANSFIMNSQPFGTVLIANNTDANTYYIPLSKNTSGTWSNAIISSSFSYIPSTKTIYTLNINANNLYLAGNASICGHYFDNTSASFIGTVSTASANILSQTLTDAPTISWNTSLGQVATVTLGANRVMGAPTNLKVGSYILHVIQDATGTRTLTWNSVFKWPAGVAPVLSSTANSRDIFSFVCDGTNLYGSFLPDVK